MRTLFALASLSAFTACSAQLIVANPSFEEMSSCPDLLSQIALATGWHDVVGSSDYYNCGFTSSVFPTSSAASDGTGYACFASYGNAGGASEAIGQDLDVPASAGNYPITLDVKRANGGTYMSDCGGVAIYGLPDTLPAFVTGVHASGFDGAVLLGTTALVDNVDWQQRSVTLVVPSTIRSIVFTTAYTPNCAEAIFIDDIRTHGSPTAIAEITGTKTIAVYPNPVVDRIHVDLAGLPGPLHWTLQDATGRIRSAGVFNSPSCVIDVDALQAGSYILNWTTADGTHGAERMVKVY